MHPNEIKTDAALVRRLLAGQFPQWADLRIAPVASYGTDHDIYRLGDHLAARLPRIGWATKQAALEAKWLPKLAPHLPLALPVPLAIGHPADGYPFDWSVYKWLPGENANGTINDLDQAAVDLAAFVKTLHQVDTTGAHPRPPHGRGGLLAEGDEQVRRSIAQLGDKIDGDAAIRSWEESLNASPWDSEEVWVHGDLLPGNLLVVDGRLSAVIDFGCLNVGDPACDLQPAWNHVRRRQSHAVPNRARGRRCVMVAGPRLGALPGRVSAAVLLGHQPRHDPSSLTRAGAGPR